MEVFNEAANLLNSGKFNEVIEYINKYLDENPQFKTIDYHHFSNPIEEILFDVYVGKIDEVKVLDLKDNLDEIYHVLAIAYDAIGDKENSEKFLKIANRINPVSCPILMRLCEHYQSKNEEHMIKDFALDIMTYSYNTDLLVSSYFKLADYYYHTNQEMELYDHLLHFFVQLKSGEDGENVADDIKYIEEHGIQVGFNPEVINILMYLLDLHTKEGLEGTAEYFRNILGGIVEFAKFLNELENK